MIRLIAFLGNPGKEYRETRHNAGFMALDYLSLNSKFGSFDFAYEAKFKGEIEFRNVCFSYNKQHKILDNISFHILPGEHFAIVRKNRFTEKLL